MSQLLGFITQIYGNKAATNIIYSTWGWRNVGFRMQIHRIFWICRLMSYCLLFILLYVSCVSALCMGVVPELKSKYIIATHNVQGGLLSGAICPGASVPLGDLLEGAFVRGQMSPGECPTSIRHNVYDKRTIGQVRLSCLSTYHPYAQLCVIEYITNLVDRIILKTNIQLMLSVVNFLDKQFCCYWQKLCIEEIESRGLDDEGLYRKCG